MGRPKTIQLSRSIAEVLLVEDDPVVGPLVRDLLSAEGYRVTLTSQVQEASRLAERTRYSLIILDIHLPDGSGLDFCRSLRQNINPVPVLMLTSIAEEDIVVRAFALGANDYLRKPFGKKELLARVKFQTKGSAGILEVGPMRIDVGARQASVAGKALVLTAAEMEILILLAKDVGSDVPRERILQNIDPDGQMESRTVDSHVSHLRGKLQKLDSKFRIEPIRRVGYRMEY